MHRKYSTLYNEMKYTANIDYCMNRIYEYDIRRANTTMMREYSYCSDKEIDRLESMVKIEREKIVGLMIRKDKSLYKLIQKGIIHAKYQLFKENAVKDCEILSIKNDAVFIIGRKLKHTKFDNIEFVLKNEYTGYHIINGVEFYYNKHLNKFDVKGIRDDVIEHDDHIAGMLSFLATIFKYLSSGRMDDMRKYLVKFSNDYKDRALPYYFYRELNSDNLYRAAGNLIVKDGNNNRSLSFNYEYINNSMLDDINITFNYMFYVLPIIRIHL